jgi:hypothetical protein
METVAITLLILVVLVLGGWLVWSAARAGRRDHAAPAPMPAPGSIVHRDGDRVVLDLTVDDPSAPAVQRLALDLAARTFAHQPELRSLTIVDRTGRELLRTSREDAMTRAATLPPELSVGSGRQRRHAPDPLGHRATGTGTASGSTAPAEQEPIRALGPRPFAARFELSRAVTDRLGDPTDPGEVIAAILAAGGREVQRHGDLVVAGDIAVIAVDVGDDAERALSRGFVRIRDSGMPRGIVIRLGYVDPALVRRHDRAAPHVHHLDVTSVQTMADATVVGADPIDLALAHRTFPQTG